MLRDISLILDRCMNLTFYSTEVIGGSVMIRLERNTSFYFFKERMQSYMINFLNLQWNQISCDLKIYFKINKNVHN